MVEKGISSSCFLYIERFKKKENPKFYTLLKKDTPITANYGYFKLCISKHHQHTYVNQMYLHYAIPSQIYDKGALFEECAVDYIIRR